MNVFRSRLYFSCLLHVYSSIIMLSDFGPEWEAGELSKFMIKIHDHFSPKRVYLQREKVVARPVEGDGAGGLECRRPVIFTALALATVATLGRDIWWRSPSSQCYAPDPATPAAFHRTLLLFLCRHSACWAEHFTDPPILGSTTSEEKCGGELRCFCICGDVCWLDLFSVLQLGTAALQQSLQSTALLAPRKSALFHHHQFLLVNSKQ